jgi:hypothetical protein
MKGQTIFFIELVLVHGAVLGWAVWELISLRRQQRRDRAAAAEALSANGPGHAEGQHRPDQG